MKALRYDPCFFPLPIDSGSWAERQSNLKIYRRKSAKFTIARFELGLSSCVARPPCHDMHMHFPVMCLVTLSVFPFSLHFIKYGTGFKKHTHSLQDLNPLWCLPSREQSDLCVTLLFLRLLIDRHAKCGSSNKLVGRRAGDCKYTPPFPISTPRNTISITWRNSCKYTTSADIQKLAIKKLVTHVESYINASAVSLLKSGE